MKDQVIECLSYVTIDECDAYTVDMINNFDCGEEGLNNFLKIKAIEHHRDMLGSTTLCILEDLNVLVGYYTLKSSSLLYSLDNYTRGIPAIEVVIFAIDKKYQANGIGTQIFKSLIYDIYEYSLDFSSAKAITLYALKDDSCINFYERLNFLKLEDFMGLIYDECKNVTIPMYLRLK